MIDLSFRRVCLVGLPDRVVEMDNREFNWLRSGASSSPVEQLSAGELERRIVELQDSIADLSGSRRRARSRLDLSPGRSEDVRAMGRASSTA